MTQAIELLPELLHDEVVQFIARRHNASVEIVLNAFEAQSGNNDLQSSITLETNELQLINDLIDIYSQKNNHNLWTDEIF